MHLQSDFQIVSNWPKIWKITMTSQFVNMKPSSIFLVVVLFLLSSLVTGPSFMSRSSYCHRVMIILFNRILTRNPEIGNTLVWVLPNIWGLGRIRDTKFGTNMSNEMLLNATKCQGYNFCLFRVLTTSPPHPE